MHKDGLECRIIFLYSRSCVKCLDNRENTLFTCKFCGFGNDSPLANICIHCGPQMNWHEDEVDLPTAIHNYVDSLSDLYFAPDVDEDIALIESRRIRQRLKISHSVEKVLRLPLLNILLNRLNYATSFRVACHRLSNSMGLT